MKRSVCFLLLLLGCAQRGQIKVIMAPRIARPSVEALAAAAPSSTPSRTIKILPGDSFWRIARREMGSGLLYNELAIFNGLTPKSLLRPGRTLEVPGTAMAVPKEAENPAGKHLGVYNWPKRENHAYTLGEKLTFAVQYFNATAGYATLNIGEYSVQQGRVTLHIVAEAKTTPFFETFFKVRDSIETYIDVDSLIPLRYEKHLREGGYSADAFYTFDQRAHMMYEPNKGHSVTVSAETQDVLSCFFWFRTMELTPGKDMIIKVASDEMKSYELVVNVLRRERVSTLAGDFDCILVQPHLKYAGLFQQKGDVFVWITDDARRIPVKIQTKIAIGTININLQDAEWVQPQ
jgi:hypothetical protein